jgi:hypothetical protein
MSHTYRGPMKSDLSHKFERYGLTELELGERKQRRREAKRRECESGKLTPAECRELEAEARDAA